MSQNEILKIINFPQKKRKIIDNEGDDDVLEINFDNINNNHNSIGDKKIENEEHHAYPIKERMFNIKSKIINKEDYPNKLNNILKNEFFESANNNNDDNDDYRDDIYNKNTNTNDYISDSEDQSISISEDDVYELNNDYNSKKYDKYDGGDAKNHKKKSHNHDIFMKKYYFKSKKINDKNKSNNKREIEKNISSYLELPLKDAAEMLNMCPNTLSAKYLEVTGKPWPYRDFQNINKDIKKLEILVEEGRANEKDIIYYNELLKMKKDKLKPINIMIKY